MLGNMFDEKTMERLERERQQTVRGLQALKVRGKTRDESLESQQRKQHEDGKEVHEGDEDSAQKSKDVEVAKETDNRYRFTKLSKLKILRLKKEIERRDAYLNQYKRWKFFTSVFKLKTSLLNQEWNRTCHLKERTIIKENIRLENIMRIRWKYKIDETLPPDSIIFDKILKYKRDRRKQAELRKERMVKIIQKITREMTNGIRFLRKPESIATKKEKENVMKTILEKINEESSVEMSTEETRSDEQDLEIHSKILEEDLVIIENKEAIKKEEHIVPPSKMKDKMRNPKRKSLSKEAVKIESNNETKEEVPLDDQNDFDESTIIRESMSSTTEAFPKDTCFYANPNIVVFDDFKMDKKYARKVTITNKTAKWAYLRFNKVHTETWEPGVVEIDIMDAARVKPGLHATVNVKFSPVYDEKVAAEISFLTLSPDDPKTFHEFRVPVLCTPERPVPVLEPEEIRFPTAPVWKFNDQKFNERTLTISNQGGKPFSILIGERDHRKDSFAWHFDEAEAQSAKPSILCINEGESGEHKMEDTTENILDTPRKMFQIEVPSRFKCLLRITFRPRYVGLHHEVVKICFSSDERIFGKQDLPIWAQVTGSQIHLDPACVDLGVAMIDSDVCQQTFNIINTGRSSVEVLMKTPKGFGDRVTVHPRSTTVQPESFCAVSVRLTPESDFLDLSKRFYDQTSSMLEFPVHVQMVAKDAEKPPPLILKVLANLTTCHGLILEPAFIDLGLVHTHESVFTELTLANDSFSLQEYAFLNLPPFMEIQPNHGFGTILAGETICLHLIYSACITDIPGNEIGANGLAGERRFQIEVTTLAELAGNRKQRRVDELRNLYGRQSMIVGNRSLPPEVSMYPKVSERIPEKNDQSKADPNNSSNSIDSFIEEKDDPNAVEIADDSMKRLHQPDRRKQKNVIDVFVHIVDTFCEMSEQILEFPATPFGSFSTASVHLRGFNMASHPHCTCGIVKNQGIDFTARYEFKCSSDGIKIVPQSGVLHSKEFVKISFIFEPELPKPVAIEESHEPAMDTGKQERKKQGKSEKDDKSSRKGRTRRLRTARKQKADEDEASILNKLMDQVSLLETLEPYISTIFVTCTIDLETKSGPKRSELLFLKLACPVTKPEILILNQDCEIVFGPTAIGTSSRKLLFVKNISNKNVKVEASLLDPFGPFFVPPGKMIETGSLLKLPVTYQPTQDHQEEEVFEVSAFKTRTKWRVKVSGRGVVPSYVLRPRIGVARFEIIDDKPVELRMSVQNTGSCPLTFQLRVIDVFEGNFPRAEEQSREKPSNRGRKGKIDGESEGKTPRKPEFGDVLRRHEELAIFSGELKQPVDPGCFSFPRFDENMQLSVREREKVEFGIRFQRPSKEGISARMETGEKPSKGKKREPSKWDEVDKSNYCYVAVLKLMLGSSTLVQDIVMICSLK